MFDLMKNDTALKNIKDMIDLLIKKEKQENYEITEICSEFMLFLETLNHRKIDKIIKQYEIEVIEEDRSYLDLFYYTSYKLDENEV